MTASRLPAWEVASTLAAWMAPRVDTTANGWVARLPRLQGPV